MAFYGYQFSFDSIPCFEYGLMVYDFGSPEEDGVFASSPTTIYEDRVVHRYTPLHYGISQNTPLKFTFVFGADMETINKRTYLDRWEMEAIATWLTGHSEYKYLEITQPDMEAVRYKCLITNLEYITYGKYPWAFRCEVTCDSPYAYLYPQDFAYNITTQNRIKFDCRASSKFYYPKLEISLIRGNSFSIVNHTDNNREFSFTGLPSYAMTISVDNENQIITNSRDINLYNYFNFNFLRLLNGYNDLEFLCSSATVRLHCEFPINVGG